MKGKKMIFKVIGCFALMVPGSNIALEVNGDDTKVVPVVSYCPENYVEKCRLAFANGKEAFYVTRNDESFKFYWKNDLLRQGEYRQNEVRSCFTDAQVDFINGEDSVFVFKPFPTDRILPGRIKYLGSIKNGGIFVFSDNELLSLDGFILKTFGSIGNYIQLYTRGLENLFYEPRGEIFNYHNREAAKSFLKGSFLFNLMSGNNQDAKDLLEAKVGQRLRMTPEQKSVLRVIGVTALERDDDVLKNFLSGKSFNLAEWGDLSSAFSADDVSILQDVVREENARVSNSFNFLRLSISNVDDEGRYRTDRDEFVIVKDEVFK